MTLTPAQREKRDLEDLGRILLALREQKGQGDQLVRSFVDRSEESWRFSSDFEFKLGHFSLQCTKSARVVRTGGSALVFQCSHRDQPLLKFALKVSRPSAYDTIEAARQQDELSDLEYINHAPLSHKNIARLYIAHPLKVGPLSVRALLVEWIDDSKKFCSYLRDTPLRWPSVLDLLVQIFDGLEHLHATDLVHWDMKSDNILVGSDGVPRLTDIGNARRKGAGSTMPAYSTLWNIPKKILPPADVLKTGTFTSRRTPINVPDGSWDSPWLDLWMLGRELNRIFLSDPATLALDDDPTLPFPERAEYADIRARLLRSAFPDDDAEAQYALRFIHLIIRRLTACETPAGQSYYTSAAEVVRDLSKLQHEFGAAQNLPELQAIPQHVLRLPHSGNVALTLRVKAFLNSAPVYRLKGHLQLGVVKNVYPGATHCRSEHLFGVLDAVTQYVRALYADRSDPFWRISVEQRDIEALLTAALLHDIGHIAFGHALEEMSGLFEGRMHEDYAIDVARGSKEDGAPLAGCGKTGFSRQ